MAKKKNTSPANTSPRKRARAWRILGAGTGLLLRTILFTVMLVLLLMAGAWIAALKMFNAQQLSESLARRLQNLFNRPVAVGSLDLKFLNTIELKNFAVLDDEVRPGEPFLSADSVLIRYKLLPLLERQLVIDEVTLERPRINLVRAENGQYNVPPVRLPKGRRSYESEVRGERIQISMEDWNIKEGVLSYRDLGRGVSHAVYGLNVHFEKLDFNELSRFRLDTVLRNRWDGNISDIEIRGTGQINLAGFDWKKFALRNFKTQISLLRKPIQATLDLDNLLTPFFTVRIDAPAFDPKDLSVFAPDLPEFNVPASQITARGMISNSYTQLKLDEAVAQTDNTSVTVSGTADWAQQPFTLSLQAKTDWADLATLSRRWPVLQRFSLTGKARGEATIKRQKGKYAFPLVQLYTEQAGGDFWGFLAKNVTGDLETKEDFSDWYVKTTDGHVTVAKTVLDKLNLSGTWRKGNAYLYISSGLLNEVPIKLRVAVDNLKSSKRKISTNLHLKLLDPMQFIGVVFDFTEVIAQIPKKKMTFTPAQEGDLAWLRNFRDRLPTFMPTFSGTFSADELDSAVLSGKNFNAEFNLHNLLPGAAKLSGTLDISLKDGIIHQMEKLAEEQQALNITFTPFIMMHRMESSGSFKVGEVLKDVAFTEMSASADFKDGTMIINNAFTQGPVISAAVSGWTDWVRETFELVIWTMFTPSSRRGVLAENLTDESGNPALAFKVSSSMLKPRLEMLRAKKTNTQIQAARLRGLRTDFNASQKFVKGEFHAKK